MAKLNEKLRKGLLEYRKKIKSGEIVKKKGAGPSRVKAMKEK